MQSKQELLDDLSRRWREGYFALEDALPEPLLTNALGIKLLGQLLGKSVDDEADEAALSQFRSETSIEERRLFYNLMRFFWSGEGDVLEIGPFLGGTTRALALGMLRSGRLAPPRKLYTYDRFCAYYSPEELSKIVKPLVADGLVPASVMHGLQGSTQFLDVFKALHRNTRYAAFLDIRPAELPAQAGAPQQGPKLVIDPGSTFEVVLIDGCKGWYPTKFFMQQLSSHVRAGRILLFQDYAWLTCFWIAAWAALMWPKLQMFLCSNTTYGFKLRAPYTAAEVETAYPDTPESLGAERLIELFTALQVEALKRDDAHAYFIHAQHIVAALTYIGDKQRARSYFQALEASPLGRMNPERLRALAKSPTYGPDGKGMTF